MEVGPAFFISYFCAKYIIYKVLYINMILKSVFVMEITDILAIINDKRSLVSKVV